MRGKSIKTTQQSFQPHTLCYLCTTVVFNYLSSPTASKQVALAPHHHTPTLLQVVFAYLAFGKVDHHNPKLFWQAFKDYDGQPGEVRGWHPDVEGGHPDVEGWAAW